MSRILHAILSLVSIAGLACASAGVPATWIDAEGRPASEEAVQAAHDECYAEVDAELPRTSRTFDHIVWGRAMRECMQGRGFVLVERPPEADD